MRFYLGAHHVGCGKKDIHQGGVFGDGEGGCQRNKKNEI